MLLTRKYHFYAAHRNQELCDKCRNIHGHQYEVRVTFDLEKKSSITVLFAELDAKVKPIIDLYDHGMLIDRNDPLFPILKQFDPTLKFVVFHAPTSVENLVQRLYFQITILTKLPVHAIEVDETKSSTLRYTKEDAMNDTEALALYTSAEASPFSESVTESSACCATQSPKTTYVTDTMWRTFKNLFDIPETSGRRSKVSIRQVLECIIASRIQGIPLSRMPKVKGVSAITCKRYFDSWVKSGVWNSMAAVIAAHINAKV